MTKGGGGVQEGFYFVVGADKVGIRVLGAGFGSTLELLFKFKASERIPARVIYKATAVELKRKLRKGQRNR